MIGKLIERWATPAGIAVVAAGTVWLVQLNLATLNHSERLSVVELSQTSMAVQMHETAVILSRISALQDALYERVDGIEDRIERNEALIFSNTENDQ